MTDKAPLNVYTMFETDRDAEENGKWFPIAGEMSIKIRRFKSKLVNKTRERLEKPLAGMRRHGTLPVDVMEGVLHKTLCQAIIVDWKGFYDTTGAAIPFSPEAADKLLTDLPEFRDRVTSMSIEMDGFRAEDDDKTEGN
jgi:hypothetical protein